MWCFILFTWKTRKIVDIVWHRLKGPLVVTVLEYLKPSTSSHLFSRVTFLPQRKSTTSKAIPCCWQRSLTGSNTSSISLFLSTRVSVKVELRNIRIVFCTSLGSMMFGRTSVGPEAYWWETITNVLKKKGKWFSLKPHYVNVVLMLRL